MKVVAVLFVVLAALLPAVGQESIGGFSDNTPRTTVLWASGNDFLRLCEAPKGEYEAACGYWLVGVQHGMQLEDQFRPEHKSSSAEVAINKVRVEQLARAGKKPSVSFPNGDLCIPDSVTHSQMRLVVIKYMKDHPTQLNSHAGLLVVAALKDAWVCQ
jgi:hypothetical protein